MGGYLEHSLKNYGTIQLFLDMMSAGWTVPEWLKDTEELRDPKLAERSSAERFRDADNRLPGYRQNPCGIISVQ